ncbi:MAG: hypothetical protein KBD90_04740 [Alphaproteobacteria bacterium]|nr:hypothetical protein [Alphaproteobacteria bacterium]
MKLGVTHHVLAVDVEVSGCSLTQNGIVSIGASLQDQDSNELHAFQVNVQLPEGRIYEEKCLKEFWRKNKKIYAFVQQNAISPLMAMEQFDQFLTQVETTYPELILVSDNPGLDIAWLNLYLAQYTDRLSLSYAANQTYRTIWDTQSMQKVLLSQRGDFDSTCGLPKKLGFKSKWVYDHNPLNDARTIADFFNQTVKEMRKG